jgi:hypothetical protein
MTEETTGPGERESEKRDEGQGLAKPRSTELTDDEEPRSTALGGEEVEASEKTDEGQGLVKPRSAETPDDAETDSDGI